MIIIIINNTFSTDCDFICSSGTFPSEKQGAQQKDPDE